MSVFSHLSHSFRSSLVSTGLKLPLGHVHQILVAGLGHGSLASFKVHDHAALEKAESVVSDAEAMVGRAKALGHSFSIEAVGAALRQCRFRSRGTERAMTPLGNMTFLVRVVGMDDPHPEKQAIANRLNGQPNGTQLLYVEPAYPIEASLNDWRWRAKGELTVACDELEYRVPISCEVVFPKVGRQLFGTGYIAHLVQSGESIPHEPEFITEFDPHAGSY